MIFGEIRLTSSQNKHQQTLFYSERMISEPNTLNFPRERKEAAHSWTVKFFVQQNVIRIYLELQLVPHKQQHF